MNEIYHRLLQDRAVVTLPVGLALAVLVTLHILLRKREVASAVGWIGFVWFAPISGAIAYALLGINRVQRRARRLQPPHRRRDRAPGHSPAAGGDSHLDPLQHGIGRITGRTLLPGNCVQIYHDGDEAYPPMLEAIAAARQSVGLSSYIFRDDEWGGRFIQALAEAHARGVAVRVLIDGIGGGWLLSPAWRRLRKHGVPAARFLHSPLPWRMPFLNLRSHRKILVIDGTTGFTGGMNIADENVMATNPKHPVQDTHFRLQGPVVAQLTEAFTQDWCFATDENLEGPAWFPDLQEAGEAAMRIVDSGPDRDIEKIEFAMLQAIACARSSISIMTPYFLPDERLASALALADLRGVAVEIVIPHVSDHRFVDWATRANSGPLLANGVRIWRCPPPFRHSKIAVVDGQWSLIGSCNWDSRSFRLNFELNAESYEPALAEALCTLMKAAKGPELTLAELRTRTLTTRLRDAACRLLLPYL